MAIQNTQINTTNTDLLPDNGVDYTVPANKRYAITTIMVCNTQNTDSAFDLHLVKSGDPIGVGNLIVNNLTIAAQDTFTFDSEKIVLEAGDRIVASAQPASNQLTATVSWLEV